MFIGGETMDNSNKAIAKRICKELNIRGWTQTDLLKEIIKFKKPTISKNDLYSEVIKKKGNFSTTLKGNNDRSVPKEDLYIISKIFGVPLEYIWFGDEKKSGFIPKGARYVAYQDIESEYRTYIANLEHEDRVQYPDESGFNLFDYFGQFDSINGFRFFVKNYNLHFDYVEYGGLAYVNSEGYLQLCSSQDKQYLISDNLIRVLIEQNDIKTFKKVYFENCSLKRFGTENVYYWNKHLFSDDFLKTLLQNEPFFELILKTKDIDLSVFSKYYDKNTKRCFVEPMLFETLSYALQHEEDYKTQLSKMLIFVLEYSKSQYEFVKNYLKEHQEEHGDVHIDQRVSRFLKSCRDIPMGNVFKIREKVSDEKLANLLKEIEQCTFNMTHIINEQEKNDEEIKISTPDNPLFIEVNKNALEQNIKFIPKTIHLDKEFTYFQYYESAKIDFNNLEHVRFIIECLNKAQYLVESKTNKVLVHGNLTNAAFILEDGKPVGIAGWQKCHYGNKYEDPAELISNIDFYSYGSEFFERFEKMFDIISQNFSREEKVKLLDKAIDILTNKRKNTPKDNESNLNVAYWLKEKASKLEFFKELYFDK